MELEKNIFDVWNIEKKEINTANNTKEFFVNEREIWFVKMGQNIGFEENGKREFLRPVLVIKKVGNLFLTAALTSKGKQIRFYHKFEDFELQNKKYYDSSFVILSQVKVMDKKRFFENIGIVSKKEFEEIKEKLRMLLL